MCVSCLCWLNRSPFACVCVCVCVSMDLFFFGMLKGYVYVRMLYLLDTDFFLCSELAPLHTLQITLQIQYTSCVCGCGFSVNFNVDMYLVLRSPISRR